MGWAGVHWVQICSQVGPSPCPLRQESRGGLIGHKRQRAREGKGGGPPAPFPCCTSSPHTLHPWLHVPALGQEERAPPCYFFGTRWPTYGWDGLCG